MGSIIFQLILAALLTLPNLRSQSLSPEYALKIEAIRKTIRQEMDDHRKTISTTKTYMASLTSRVGDDIQHEMNVIRSNIRNGKEVAASRNIKICECFHILDALNIPNDTFELDVNKLNKCQHQDSMEFLENELSYLTNVHDTLNKTVRQCMKLDKRDPFAFLDDWHPCIDQTLSQIEWRISYFRQVSKVFAKGAYKECFVCLRSLSNFYRQNIFPAGHQYAVCIYKRIGEAL
ncbi:unnamed protein product [Phyllotreta striolata]|uniref:Venom protein n=1 Tax=Phyllotreta striolata TaxID=444603 RepID=A0A9N9TGU1_PHYSR|nr:unnamed protein product [Phyllotreta striolata]